MLDDENYSFVTIQNNILLKSGVATPKCFKSFVTIQNNILLKFPAERV